MRPTSMPRVPWRITMAQLEEEARRNLAAASYARPAPEDLPAHVGRVVVLELEAGEVSRWRVAEVVEAAGTLPCELYLLPATSTHDGAADRAPAYLLITADVYGDAYRGAADAAPTNNNCDEESTNERQS